LKAQVPAPLLARYVRSRPVQTHILLSDAAGRAPMLLDLLNSAKGLEWYAAANLLLRDKAPGLAMHLLRTVRLQLIISVSEGGNVSSVGSGGVAVGVGDGVGQTAKGFPPHAAYRFETAASPGFVVLAHGPRPVFYSRTVHTDFQYGVSQLHDYGPTDDDRLTYLQAMADPFSPPTLKACTNEVASWTTPVALLEDVDELRRDLERRFDSIRERIEELYKLPEVPSRPAIDVQLVDRRKNRSAPLPAIPR
jgi:hypothetical protein